MSRIDDHRFRQCVDEPVHGVRDVRHGTSGQVIAAEALPEQGVRVHGVGAGAFEHCDSLAGADFKTAELPEGIFQGCSALDSLTLAEGTLRIRERAFFGAGKACS